MRRLTASIVTFAAFWILIPGHASCDESGDALLASVIEEVKNAIPAANLSSWGTSETENTRWAGMIVQCKNAFGRLFGRSDERLLVYKFVSEFGKHGAEADFAIMMAMGRYGVPAQSGNASLVFATGPEDSKDDVFKSRQLLVAECQTRLFLKDPDLMDRYTQFLVWAGFLDEFAFTHYKRVATDSMASGAYWWNARNALVLMYCSGDGIEDIKDPESVYKAYVDWLGHVSEIDIEFPDRTTLLPFSDWTGVTPVPGKAFREIFD
jgi:hypothetical protein